MLALQTLDVQVMFTYATARLSWMRTVDTVALLTNQFSVNHGQRDLSSSADLVMSFCKYLTDTCIYIRWQRLRKCVKDE